MTQDWRLKLESGVPGSRGRAIAVKAREKTIIQKEMRQDGNAVGTGVETRGDEINEVNGFESARGKVGRSKWQAER
jgi:hypothetical protein